jgi:hypothetical protein
VPFLRAGVSCRQMRPPGEEPPAKREGACSAAQHQHDGNRHNEPRQAKEKNDASDQADRRHTEQEQQLEHKRATGNSSPATFVRWESVAWARVISARRVAPVPDVEAFDVKLNALVGGRAHALHEKLPGANDVLAGVTLFTTSRATPDAGDVVVREPAVGNLRRMMRRSVSSSMWPSGMRPVHRKGHAGSYLRPATPARVCMVIVVETLPAGHPGQHPGVIGGVAKILGPSPVPEAVDQRRQHEDVQDGVP